VLIEAQKKWNAVLKKKVQKCLDVPSRNQQSSQLMEMGQLRGYKQI